MGQMRLSLTGTDCNQACRYCRAMYNIPGVHCNKDEDIMFDEAAITKAISEYGIENIQGVSIWGGEPLLDFSRFKKGVQILQEIMPQNIIGIVTNGTLLNNDVIVDFLLKNKIRVTLSHDGPMHHLRGHDWLKDPAYANNLSRLQPLQVHSVFHKDNIDMEAIEKYYGDISKETGWTFYWSMEVFKAMSPESMPYAVYGNSIENLKKAMRHIVREYFKGNPFYSSMKGTIESTGKMFDSGIGKQYRCGMDSNIIVDQHGKKWLCQVEAETKESPSFPPGNPPSYCMECPVVSCCHGICPLLNEHYRRQNCQYRIAYYLTIKDVIKEMYQENVEGGDTDGKENG